jgi:hypothetical protein
MKVGFRGNSVVLLERRSWLRRSRSQLRSGSRTAGGEHGRGDVAQGAVRPPVVVIVLPSRRELPRRGQTLELFGGQELIPQPAVKALDVAVLPGTARLDVERLDADLAKPLTQGVSDKLRAVVAAMHFGTPRIARSPASVSITSSLVMLRSTFKARHSRVYTSTIDSHFSGLPAVVQSNTKSHVQTWSFASADRRAQSARPGRTPARARRHWQRSTMRRRPGCAAR